MVTTAVQKIAARTRMARAAVWLSAARMKMATTAVQKIAARTRMARAAVWLSAARMRMVRAVILFAAVKMVAYASAIRSSSVCSYA